MGASEAAATPANAKTIGEWFPEIGTSCCRRLGGRGFLHRCDAGPAYYLLCSRVVWLAGCVYVYRRAGAAVGDPLVWAFYHNPEQHPNLSKDELAFIKQDNEPPAVKLPFLTALKTVSKNKRFYGIAIPAFMAEPAWAVLSRCRCISPKNTAWT